MRSISTSVRYRAIRRYDCRPELHLARQGTALHEVAVVGPTVQPNCYHLVSQRRQGDEAMLCLRTVPMGTMGALQVSPLSRERAMRTS